MFTSVMLTSMAQMPGWMHLVARANAVSWAVTAARSAMLGTDTHTVVSSLAALLVLAIVAERMALVALARYQRSL
jgi:ABC-type multidrug transport system permease subunit